MALFILPTVVFVFFMLWAFRPTGLFLDMYWQGHVLEYLFRAVNELDEWYMLATGKPKYAFSQMMQRRAFVPLKRPCKIDGLEIMDHFLTDEKILVRVYRNLKEGYPLAGALIFSHGGGWAVGSVGAYESFCRTLARKTGFTVFSIEYSLSLEAKFPVAHNQCYSVLCYVSRNAADFGIDPANIVVAGDSAGGNLAAASVLRARNDPQGPKIRGQVLIYPVVDSNFFTDSYNLYARRSMLVRSRMVDYFSLYIRTPDDLINPYVAPMRAASLKGLPPAFVVAAEHDPLRDEALGYARKMEKEGVSTRCVRVKRGFHGFMTFAAEGPMHIEDAGRLLDEIAVWMNTL